jgi:hypothetical protein
MEELFNSWLESKDTSTNIIEHLKTQKSFHLDFLKYVNEQCNIPIVTTRLKVGTKVCKNRKTKIGVINSKSDFGFNHWIVEWDGGEFTREYGHDLNVW